VLALRLLTLPTLLLLALPHAGTSTLWGRDGEEWTPSSRLPDFPYAGYPMGVITPPQDARGPCGTTVGSTCSQFGGLLCVGTTATARGVGANLTPITSPAARGTSTVTVPARP
jgi:hypothetical protein